MSKIPSNADEKAPDASRRRLMKAFGSVIVAAPAMTLLGCGTPTTSSSSSSSVSSSSLSSSSSSSASSTPATPPGWTAKGGTASMWADFPPADAFAGTSTTTCKVYKGPSLGPCLFGLRDERQDISEGELGLPMIFAFKILDSRCQPAAGITVEVWHTNCEGFYSGNTSGATYLGPNWNFGGICTNNNRRAETTQWHRGAQVTNNEGIVYFKSCFPGWYTGRTNHVHLRCSENNNQLFFTQFAWTDELCREIHVNHPEYIGRPQDTPLSGFDPEFGSNAGTDMILNVKKLEDGTMLSSKIVTMG